MADPVAPGAALMQQMLDGGAPAAQVSQYADGLRAKMLDGGAPPAQVDQYFGTVEPDMSKLANQVNTNLATLSPEDKARIASNPADLFRAGMQMSSTSLLAGKPNIVPPEHVGTLGKILVGAGQTVGDIPAGVVGFAGGAAAGALVPGAGETGISELVGGGAGAGALPEAIRSVMMDHYAHAEKGPATWPEIWQRAASIVMNTGKSAAIGAVAMPIGGAVGARVAAAGGGVATAGAANMTAQAVTATGMGAAIEGKVPDADDFIAGAVVALGLHAAGTVVGATKRFAPSRQTEDVAANLRDVYARTGLHPDDAIRAGENDPALKQEILAPRAPDGTAVTPGLHAIAPPEPQPFKPEPQIIPEEPATGSKFTVSPQVRGMTHGAEPALSSIMEEASKGLPDGWRAEVISAERPGATVAGNGEPSLHAAGNAIDVTLISPGGHRITNLNRGPGTPEYEVYKNFAQLARNAVEKLHPELSDQFDWGGNFLHAGPNQYDLMHFQIGGNRGLGGEARTPTQAPAEGEPGIAWTAPDPVKTDDLLPMFSALEGSADDAVSPKGAVGKWQIMPDTARAYGFDPSRLTEPAYNRQVATAVVDDLQKKFGGNMVDMLVAYNAGPGRARAWIAGGRQFGDLPLETQHYLENAERHGYIARGLNKAQMNRGLIQQGDNGEWLPAEGQPPKPPGPPGPPGPPEPPEPAASGEEPLRLSSPKETFPPHDEDTLDDIIMDAVAPDAKKGMLPDWLNFRDLINTFQSQLAPARRLDRRVGIGEEDLGAEDMLRQTYASRERAGYFVRWGVLDPLTLLQKSDASFVHAYEAVKNDGGTLKGFLSYRLAARTMEKAQQGIETGVNPEAAAAKLTAPGVHEKYARGARIMRQVKDGSIDYARDSGLFSAERAEAMKKLNQEHIVMRRVFEPEYNPPRPPGRAFGVRTPVRKMKGGDRQIVNPLTSEIDNLHTMLAMADRNRAVGSIINEINGRLPPEAAVFSHVKTYEPPKPEPTGAVRDESGRPIMDTWTDEEGHPIDPRAAEAIQQLDTYRVASKSLGPNEFVYFNDGKTEIWHTKDPDLADVLRMPWTQQSNVIARIAGSFARLQRAGITAALDFPFRAVLHGQLAAAAFAQDRGSMIPYHDVMAGFWHVWNQDGTYRRWIASGGAGVALSDMDVNYINKDIKAIFETETGSANAVWNSFTHPIQAARALQHMIDASARVGRFADLERATGSSFKAAMQSRTAYLDHAEPRAAAWLNTWARAVPFMNIAFKDIEQVKKPFERPGGATAGEWLRFGAGAAVKASVVLMTPTIVNYALNALADQTLAEKDRYDQVPRWERDMYWVLPPINGVRLKIKKPYVGSVPFSIMPERFLDFVRGEVGASKDLWSTISDQMIPPFVPSVLYPGAEAWADKQFYSGRPLVPARLEKASGYMQYGPNTTETAKKLAQILGPGGINLAPQGPSRMPGFNPIVTDEFIRQWTGSLPYTALRVLEAPFKPPGAPSQIADIPFVGAFFVRQTPGSLQTLSDFHDEMQKFEAAHADVELAIKQQNLGQVNNQQLVMGAVKLGNFQKALTNMSAVLAAINSDAEMTKAEKRAQTDKIAEGMLETAKVGLTVLRGINK